MPSKKQWKYFFHVFNKKEKIIFLILCLFFLCSLSFSLYHVYSQKTTAVAKSGGTYKEGMVGQPRFVNPLYLSSQDIDRDIVEIMYSGLMKYDEQADLTTDLARDFQIENAGKTFRFFLKENILWHDGEPLTTDDIVFTVSLTQNPEYQSPLRIKWTGVLTERVSKDEIIFKLPKKYPGFLETLTLKILPEHIFKDISPNNIPLSLISKDFLVGSGPFKFKNVKQDSSGFISELTLEKNKQYYNKEPYLDKISFLFFKDERELQKALNMGEVDGAASAGSKAYAVALPRYFALFFNLEKETFEKELREALSFAVDREKIIEKVFQGKARKAESPILPTYFGFACPSSTNYNAQKADEILTNLGFVFNQETKQREKIKELDPDFVFSKNLTLNSQGREVQELQKCLAKDPEVYPDGIISGYFGSKTRAAVIKFQEKYKEEILTPIGLSKGTGDVKPMTRDKLNEICFEKDTQSTILEITLTTSDKFPLNEIADMIKQDWEALGITVNIEKVSLANLQTDVLANRNFDILLFGEALGSIADPFPFWHSSQKDYPGLNVSGYSSKVADQLLEQAREAEAEEEKREKLESFQKVIGEDLPAIFLIRPDFLYLLSPKVKGFNVEKITEPAKRFSTIDLWYVKTRRIWK